MTRIAFHRVIDGFMAQTGDPRATAPAAGARTSRPSSAASATFAAPCRWRGRKSPDSADSQFFICFAPAALSSTANTRSSARVTSGMEFIDAIKKGDESRNGSVANPDRIIKKQVAADADKDAQ